MVALLACGASVAPALSAAIVGEQHAPPGEETAGGLRIELAKPPGAAAGDATVIHFSVLPSDGDPGQSETRIFVQRKGGRDVCVTLRSDDLVTRSYRKRGEDPFDPEVPVPIRGLTSGHLGKLVGFNEAKVFIRPDSPEYDFRMNECFAAGGENGCFVQDIDRCDAHLDEFEEICIGQGLASGTCSGADHAGVIDTMKKMVAVGQQATLVTEAGPLEVSAGDVVETPEIGGLFQPRGTALVAGPTVTGPLAGSLSPGGGGLDLTTVPNLIGLTENQARDALEAALLQLGNVAVASAGTGITVVRLVLIRPAYAQQGCDFQVDPGEVCTQDKSGIVPVNTIVNVVLQASTVDAPEPATLMIFLSGLFLVILVLGRRLNVFRAR